MTAWSRQTKSPVKRVVRTVLQVLFFAAMAGWWLYMIVTEPIMLLVFPILLGAVAVIAFFVWLFTDDRGPQ